MVTLSRPVKAILQRLCTCLNSPDSEIPHVACSSGSSSGENGSSVTAASVVSSVSSYELSINTFGGTRHDTQEGHTPHHSYLPKKVSTPTSVCRNHPCFVTSTTNLCCQFDYYFLFQPLDVGPCMLLKQQRLHESCRNESCVKEPSLFSRAVSLLALFVNRGPRPSHLFVAFSKEIKG